jgi:hypothetical protein
LSKQLRALIQTTLKSPGPQPAKKPARAVDEQDG